MELIRSTYFLSATILYASFKLFRILGLITSGVINDYLADLLCMPIVLTIILTSVRFLKKRPDFQMPLSGILFTLVYWSVYFEWFLPSRSTSYTADPLDVIAYFLGAASFFLWQRRRSIQASRG
jgi:hypothetical protein